MKILTKLSFLALIIFQVLPTTILANPPPLIHATILGNYPKVESLLRKGHPVDQVGSVGGTALHYATIFGDWQIAILLVMAGADPNKSGFTSKKSAIDHANDKGRKTKRKLLKIFRERELLRFAYRRGETPLHYVISEYNFEDAKALVINGANMEAPNIAGVTPSVLALKLARYGRSSELRKRAEDFWDGCHRQPLFEGRDRGYED